MSVAITEFMDDETAGLLATVLAMPALTDIVGRTLKRRKRSNAASAERLQTTERIVRNMKLGSPNGVSITDLLRFIVELGYDVTIDVRPKPSHRANGWIFVPETEAEDAR